jgi:hypothetical protein
MVLERVEPAAPELAVGRKPGVELGKRLGTKAVPPPPPVRPDADEARFAQHAQVLRDSWLADLELVDQLADWPLALPEELQDLAPYGL